MASGKSLAAIGKEWRLTTVAKLLAECPSEGEKGGIPQKCGTALGVLVMMRCGQLHTEQPEPRDDIFWLVGKRLITDTTPIDRF